MARVFAVFVLLAAAAAGLAAWGVLAPIGPARGQPVYVDIAPGTRTLAIGRRLRSAGVLRSPYAFELLRLTKGGTLKAGEYRFDRPADAVDIYRRLVRGDVYTVAVTIPEGYNIFDIAAAMAQAGLAERDVFLAAERSDTALIADLNPGAASLEGYLFPDTYRFARTAGPQTILSAMVRRFRQAAAQLGMSDAPPEEFAHTVILASLIEREVAVDAERPLVAGVFENRLARRIPLATDPSVIYAAQLADRWRGTIYASDLKFDSAYNTYLHTGLPPGPICNPGLAALKAALAPATTDYLYFVADAQGHSRFAATLEEHSRNVQAYRRATGNPIASTAPPSRRTSKSHR